MTRPEIIRLLRVLASMPEFQTFRVIASAADGPGVMIKRNPGVMAIWMTKSFATVPDGNKGFLFRLSDPESVTWWREGRTATRAEIEESISTGLPLLQQMAVQDGPDAELELAKATTLARTLLPA